mgnify:CR=1 FL=1
MILSIILEDEQKELLSNLVEAARNLPRENRQPFYIYEMHSGTDISHMGLPEHEMKDIYMDDIRILANSGLILISNDGDGLKQFSVTPLGFEYYRQIKQSVNKPIQRVESTVKNYVESSYFQQKYPLAYQKWVDAESKLWDDNSERQLQLIGFTCREAMQEFASALVDRYQPRDVETDKARTINRLRAVLNLNSDRLGEREQSLLEALINYWGAVNGLVQRQVHDDQKSGLTGEDARRVVFQTAIVMFEIDHSLSRMP